MVESWSHTRTKKLILHRLISMTFTRALSFTDDSVNVELPLAGLLPQSVTSSFPSSNDSINMSISLIRFRQSESQYYQDLFGANRSALLEPWQNRCGALHGLKSWFLSLSDSAPDFLKQTLRSELFYICIVLVQPQSATLTDPYGISLLFEYCVGYAQSTWQLCHHSRVFNPCTSMDLVRATFVAQRLLQLLQDPIGLLFDVEEPSPPLVSPGLVLPPLSKRTIAETAIKAIDALQQIDRVMDILGRRHGYPQAYNTFKQDSDIMLRNLYARRQHQHPFTSNHTESDRGISV